MVLQHKDIYQGFVIKYKCYNGTGILRLIHKDEASHIAYSMTIDNGLNYNKFTNGTITKAHNQGNSKIILINKLNDAWYSDLWHGLLAHIKETTMKPGHRNVERVNREI